MKAWQQIGSALLAIVLIVAVFLYGRWKRDEPRRLALQTLETFRSTLASGQGNTMLQTVMLPQALRGRTVSEQAEFLSKALRNEISPEGLAVLRREGKFGPLQKLFPVEAPTWAAQAGVKPEDCVAFRMERDNIRAEVVLVREGDAYRVVRCNNVKQLAATKL